MREFACLSSSCATFNSQTAEIGCEAMPERVPSNHLCTCKGRTDDLPEYHVRGYRFGSIQTFRRSDGNRKSESFLCALPFSNPSAERKLTRARERAFHSHQSSPSRSDCGRRSVKTATCIVCRSTSLHLRANISERRSPVEPASMTMTCSRRRSSGTSA